MPDEPVARPPDGVYGRRRVADEYEESSQCAEEYQRVRWGSRDSMVNRHAFVARTLPFETSNRWLDVGCGTGFLQEQVMRENEQLTCLGIDLSPALIREARARKIPRCRFEVTDVSDLEAGTYDLLTCMGVLPKTTVSLGEFFRVAARILVPGGLCLADAKNADWKAFAEPGFEPDPGHSWTTIDEFAEAASRGGELEIEELVGFLPRENRVVDPRDSHAIFVVVRKR